MCDQFSEKLCADVNELTVIYMEPTLFYKLSATQELRYFHNFFEDDKRHFYWIIVEPTCTTIEKACIKLQELQTGYGSIAWQISVRNNIQNLSLAPIMEKQLNHVSEPLEQLCEVITIFPPQGPRMHRSEEDKVENFCEPMLGAECTHKTLTQRYTNIPLWGFQKLWTALHST